jgi:hypothetical protein
VKALDNPPMAPRKMPIAQSPPIAITMMIPIFMRIVYNKILMKRILFFVLWAIPLLQPQAQGAIEIYANGHKYDSLQLYQASKKSIAMPSPVDFSKDKTFQVNQKNLSETALHKFYVLSVESGVIGALKDFYQTWGHSDLQMTPRISSVQLQKAIQQAVTTSKDPKLLISDQGKVRIMAISLDHSEQ